MLERWAVLEEDVVVGINRRQLNKWICRSRSVKFDEFYTKYDTIEKEVECYLHQLKDKVVYCNCDDYRVSNFYKYFYGNFHRLQLKKLITTGYSKKDVLLEESHDAVCCVYDGKGDPIITKLVKDGDFRSSECLELLEQADVVITNPPFSLFRKLIVLLDKHKKDYLLIGNNQVIQTDDIFKLFIKDEIRLGYSKKGMWFEVPDDFVSIITKVKNIDGKQYVRIGNAIWLTNMLVNSHKSVKLSRYYDENKYKKVDRHNILYLDKTKDIPIDYDGVMAVPCTFIQKYNKQQFEILGLSHHGRNNKDYMSTGKLTVDGVNIYSRILIRHKLPLQERIKNNVR